jgi:hypothetical protein
MYITLVVAHLNVNARPLVPILAYPSIVHVYVMMTMLYPCWYAIITDITCWVCYVIIFFNVSNYYNTFPTILNYFVVVVWRLVMLFGAFWCIEQVLCWSLICVVIDEDPFGDTVDRWYHETSCLHISSFSTTFSVTITYSSITCIITFKCDLILIIFIIKIKERISWLYWCGCNGQVSSLSSPLY